MKKKKRQRDLVINIEFIPALPHTEYIFFFFRISETMKRRESLRCV